MPSKADAQGKQTMGDRTIEDEQPPLDDSLTAAENKERRWHNRLEAARQR